MKLRGRYRLLVKGDLDKMGIGYSTNAIGYLFERLLSGREAMMDNLAHMSIEVRQLADNDEIISVPPELSGQAD